MDALGINVGYLLIQLLGMIILILALKGWLSDPILKVLEERKARIAKGLEDARQAAIARENADAEAKKVLDAARSEAAKIRQEAAVQAEETASGITSKANDEAKQILANAQADAADERNRVLADMRGQVVAIAIAAANKLVGDALDENRQRQLVGDFFAKVPADVSKLSGNKAVVTSALPLTDAEKAAAQKAIKAESVDFNVDPSILGGVVVRVGDQVVDNSVANQMGALREAIR